MEEILKTSPKIRQKYTKMGSKGIFEKFSFFICKIAIFDLKTYQKNIFFKNSQIFTEIGQKYPKMESKGIFEKF